MKKESKEFNKGLKFLKAKSYNEAIDLFRQDLEHNPNNPIAYHNICLAQIFLGINQKEKSLLESAIQQIRKAIIIVESNPGKTFPIANDNLKWATEELSKFNKNTFKLKATMLDPKKPDWLKKKL